MTRAEPGSSGSARIHVPGCPICQKHAGEGPLRGELVGRFGAFWIYHGPPGDDGRARLGHLFIESDRHAPYLADLTPAEAADLGPLRTRLAAALRTATDADYVLAAVIGTGIDHFHEHVFARHRGTPPDVPWHESDEAAPLVDQAAVAALARRLAADLSGA
jgi:diadenosine tetraphosphate (Ap4A) HIT family hydrolase